MSPSSPIRIRGALVAGLGLVRGATRYVLLAWAASVALALPLAATLASTLEQSLGRSEAGERMRDGFDPLWHQGFSAQAQGLSSTFDPGVVGIGAVFRGLDALVTGRLFAAHAAVLGAGLIYVLVWVFLSAGLVSRFCGRSDRGSFFAAAAHAFPRFAVLAGIAGLSYALLLGPLLGALGDIVDTLNRETIDERVDLAWSLAKYVVVWGAVWLVAVVFDHARVIAVARDPIALLDNLRQALVLVLAHKRLTLGLSASLLGIGVALTLAYWGLAPGIGPGTGGWPAILGALLLGQLFLLARIALRAWFHASQSVLGVGLLER